MPTDQRQEYPFTILDQLERRVKRLENRFRPLAFEAIDLSLYGADWSDHDATLGSSWGGAERLHDGFFTHLRGIVAVVATVTFADSSSTIFTVEDPPNKNQAFVVASFSQDVGYDVAMRLEVTADGDVRVAGYESAGSAAMLAGSWLSLSGVYWQPAP